MLTTGKDIIKEIEKYAPLTIKMAGDPTGLQIGNINNPVKRVMTTLDVRPEVVQEAIDDKIDFIFAHHPVMFHPAHNLDTTDPQKKMYADLLKNNITVYAAHTNMDKATGGMNDWLAQKLQLKNVEPFGADTDGIAIGRIGELDNPQITVQKLAIQIKQEFDIKGLRIVSNNLNQTVKHIAVVGGDGGKFYLQALHAGADVLVTGDVYYHTGHDMLAHDLTVIDPGHHIESIFKIKTKELLNNWAKTNNWDIAVISSKINTDPFTFM